MCTILVFDNLDQLDPDLQEQVIKFAFTIYQEWGSFTIISMREENYIKSKLEGSLSTIQCNQFALPRPSIVPIIERRLKCLSDDIASGKSNIPFDLSTAGVTSLDLGNFIVQISNSLASSRDKVKNFLEAIALGNIRESLEFFRNFLAAGNTNSGKIIEITKKFGSYLVPDHEFMKSISLGSRAYFSESDSPVLNLYSVSDMERPSHFTKLRILNCLSRFQYQARPYGAGFESIERLKTLLMTIGISKLDVDTSISSLTKKRLIENDLHTVKYLEKANAVRITPAGIYYLKYLLSQFAYLDLMQQDTPLFEEETYLGLNDLAESTRMTGRFERVRMFVDYLQDQETNELSTIAKITSNELLTAAFMFKVKEGSEIGISHIEKKLAKT